MTLAELCEQLDALTTQVRRIADAHTTPLDDTPTTPAPTCAAHHFGPDALRQCIRATHHKHPSHTDAHGFHWTDADAVYAAGMHPAPAADEDEQRAARRKSLRVLLNRLNNGLPFTASEAQLLTRHVAMEICDANTADEQRRRADQAEELQRIAHETSNRSEAERATAVQRAERAEAAIARVGALHHRNEHTGDCEHCSERDYPDYAAPHPCPTISALDQPGPAATQATEPHTGLVVQPYRNDRGDPAWVFRCWGTDTCDGCLSLDHTSQQSAERARDRHVTEEHQEQT